MYKQNKTSIMMRKRPQSTSPSSSLPNSLAVGAFYFLMLYCERSCAFSQMGNPSGIIPNNIDSTTTPSFASPAIPRRRTHTRLYEVPPPPPEGSSSSYLEQSYLVNGGVGDDLLNGYYDPVGQDAQEPNHNIGREPQGDFTEIPPQVAHWTEIMSHGFSVVDAPNSTAFLDVVLNDYDIQQIESYWDQLMPMVSYLGTDLAGKVYQALCVAYRAHRGQMRKSGEPFIIHPVEVSLLLAGLKMDGETVISGLLHDTVEDTELTFAQVEALFGKTVRTIVEGETKVSKLPKLAFAEYADEQAENLRQMFVAMTEDYRIIIVKLADRLHNMRTLMHMKPEKQIKISRETLDIFAPLAHRMGIWQFKSELEDTAFMYLYPQEYKRLSRRLKLHQQKYKETLEVSQEILQQQLNRDSTLAQQAAKVEVFGRTKEIYSLWHKMETKGEHNLDHIVDVVALRVVITPHASSDDEEEESNKDRGVWLCYHVLGLVQHLPGFQPVPTRVKDYISFPKPNGYQSLHTALILNGQTIEVQIRTSTMHQVAEFGMASHWAYTDGKRRDARAEELYNTPWLSSIKEWQNDIISSRDFVDSVRRELLGKRVFVFLRNGKILNLARGATVIDAAFQIHTEVGLSMHGVEINGKPVPFSYELQNGDVVNILTGEGKPATDWMRFAKSRSTRSKLRSYFRARQKESLREAGKILLEDYLWMHGPLIERNSYVEDGLTLPSTLEEVDDLLPGKTQYNDVDDMLIALGKHGDRSFLHTVASQLFLVPKSKLIAEESKRSTIPNSVVAAVHEKRKRARAAAMAAASAQNLEVDEDLEDEDLSKITDVAPQSENKPLAPQYSVESRLAGLDIGFEYADPEFLCQECLPILGDEIVGTRPPNSDSVTTVHRVGCPHAQRAINHAAANHNIKSLEASIQEHVNGKSKDSKKTKDGERVDSVSLRNSKVQLWSKRAATAAKYVMNTLDVPVRLQWSYLDENSSMFKAEIVVHCMDRKLLLADVSEVVSEAVEIIGTGSLTTNEHATLVFLVQVNSLDLLQQLMNRLRGVRSVLSVERRFGSKLM